jgi:hypothetical protein
VVYLSLGKDFYGHLQLLDEKLVLLRLKLVIASSVEQGFFIIGYENLNCRVEVVVVSENQMDEIVPRLPLSLAFHSVLVDQGHDTL